MVLMNYTYDWTCTNGHSNTNSWDLQASEIGHETLFNYCDVCGAEHEHRPLTVGETVYKICEERPQLEDMGVLLDSPHDLYDLGYIDNTLEQEIMSLMIEINFVYLYTVHNWAVHKKNKDYEWVFDQYIIELIETLSNY